MKKLFVSVPMNGRTDENIKKSIDKMHKIAEAVVGEELELIPSYDEKFNSVKEDVKNKQIVYLGKAIQLMALADYFIGTDMVYDFKGTEIEYDVARSYGVQMLPSMDCIYVAPDAIEVAQELAKQYYNTPVCDAVPLNKQW